MLDEHKEYDEYWDVDSDDFRIIDGVCDKKDGKLSE